jgi:archaellum component FlaC
MSSLSVVELGARVDALSARAEVESKAVSTTFTEMRSFVSESVGTLRREMIRRFDALDKRLTGVETRLGRVEKRFDGLEKRFDGLEERFDGFERQSARIESKLDQLLSARPAKARRTRRR